MEHTQQRSASYYEWQLFLQTILHSVKYQAFASKIDKQLGSRGVKNLLE